MRPENELELLKQNYIKNQKLTVKEYVDLETKKMGNKLMINRFACFEVGEGFEKTYCTFSQKAISDLQKQE